MDSHWTAALVLALTMGTAACGKNASTPEPGATSAPSSTAPTTAATMSAAPTTQATVGAPTTAATPPPDVPGLAALEQELRDGLPKGSGDYARALALATLHQQGKLTYPQLEAAVLALKLPPHKLGDGYLMIPVPKPPPPAKFDPKMMPKDWQGTWGEVTMAYWLGVIDKQVYRRLHKAAHPDSCKHD